MVRNRLLPLFLLILPLMMLPLSPTAAAVSTWQPIPAPSGGSIAAVVLSPDYSSTNHTLFAGLRGGGVYRSLDDGYTWQPLSPEWVVADLAISPDFGGDGVLLALTGLPTSGYSVQRSGDGGATWTTATLPGPLTAATALVISPDFATDQTVYLLTGTAVYISTDGGATFAAGAGWWATHDVTALAIVDTQTLFAAAEGAGDGLYRSDDGGANWTPLLAGIFTAVATSPDYAADNTVLALDSSGQLHRSGDGGATWTTPALIVGAGGSDTLAFSPTFASDGVVFAASSADPGPYRSADSGVSWSPAGWYDAAHSYRDGLIAGRVFDLAPAPGQFWDGTVFAATTIGVARSPYSGDGWFQMNVGLPELTVFGLDAAPDNADIQLAGVSYFENLRVLTSNPGEYDGGLFRSSNGGQTWHAVAGGLDRVTAVAFATPDVAFAATGTLGSGGFASGGIYRSLDGGANWDEVFSGAMVSALAVSPDFATDQTAWTAVYSYSSSLGIYRTQDGGATWTPLAPAINAFALAPSPNFAVDQTLFAGTPGGLQKSLDGGANWLLVGPAAAVNTVAISPAYGASQTLIWAAGNEVVGSADGGATWTALDIGLPATLNANPLLLDKVAFAPDGSLLAAGHYASEPDSAFARRSSDAGATWVDVGSGLAAEHVLDVATRAVNSFAITAATDTGLWQAVVEQGAAAEPGAWSSNGPRGGRGLALAVSPDFASDGIAFGGEWLADFQGSATGLGFFRSTDFGQTWAQGTAVPTSFYANPVLDYAPSPNFGTDQTVFAATWGDIYKSTDGGVTWTETDLQTSTVPAFVYRVAVAPDFGSSGLMLAGSGYYGDSLAVSRDGGASWESGLPVSASGDIAFADADTILTAGGGGVYRSDDAALTWHHVLTVPLRSLVVLPNFAADGMVFAGEVAFTETADLYRSSDGGATWVTRTIASEATAIQALAISPNFGVDGMVFAGTNAGLFWSADAGETWTAVAGYEDANVHRLAISPGWPTHAVLLVGMDTGVARLLSADPATGTLRQESSGFAPLSTNPLALTADGWLLTASRDHGISGSSDGGATWQPLGLIGGSGFYGFNEVAASPNFGSDGVIFAARSLGGSIGGSLYRSTDGGATWEWVLSGEAVTDVVVSPNFGSDGDVFTAVYDAGVKQVTESFIIDVGTWPVDKRGAAQQLALPPNYPADATIFAGGAKGFWRLVDGVGTWETAVSGLTADHRILAIAVSPSYAGDQTLLALAAWSDVSYMTHYGLFRSEDGGLNWTQIGTGLPDIEMRGLALSPHFVSDGVAYVTTIGGELYRSRDRGDGWTRVGSAPGKPGMNDVVVDGNGRVSVATEAGVWHYTSPLHDVIVNGGFETDGGWDLPSPSRTGITETVAYAGSHAMQVGLVNAPPAPTRVFASARQVIEVPPAAQTATLAFRMYPVSGATLAGPVGVPSFSVPLSMLATTAGDWQYVLLLDPETGATLETLHWDLSNAQQWQAYNFDLTAYAGQTLLLHFGVADDVDGGNTAVYIDDVSLLVDAVIDWPFAVHLPVVVK